MTEQEFEYYVNKGGFVTITKYNGDGGDVTFPASINGQPVTYIGSGKPLCEKFLTFTNLSFPDSVLEVRRDAFYHTRIENIDFPWELSDMEIRQFEWSGYAWNGRTAKQGGNTFQENGITYRLRTDGTLDVVDCRSDEPEIMVPAECRSRKVTRILSDAFWNVDKKLKVLHISEGITTICEGAFPHLEMLSLPTSINALSLSSHCMNLVTVQEGSFAHAYCREDGIRHIFKGTKTVAENGLTFILKDNGTAEVACWNGEDSVVNIPEQCRQHLVVRIRPDAFQEAKYKLKSVRIPAGVTAIEAGIFACSGLLDVTLPDSLKEIGREAFSGCNSLMHIRIPAGVSEIGSDAFRRCGIVKTVDKEVMQARRAHLAELSSQMSGPRYSWTNRAEIEGAEMAVSMTEYKESEKFTAMVTKGSYAERYCKDNKIRYMLK